MNTIVKPPAVSNNADPILDELLAEFANKLQSGERVDVNAYAEEHPEYAARLRELLPAMQMLVAFECSVHGGDGLPPGEADKRDAVPGELGDFRIVREVGRGGMGVVYEAQQISLNRRVALKVLPFAAALDARQLQRFKNEAQAAACLHHQNIVPVYGIGCERAVHFYAMQFIEGQTLAELIAGPRVQPAAATLAVATLSTERSLDSPAFFRAVARLGMQAAEALEHAHQLGVIHRDVKPGNLLVDVRGNLWITDFGLAHCQSQTGLTMTGDLVGTLRYMSPEQALGNRAGVDHRTDIYSLGATLYEMLTLEPAVRGSDRQELLRQIASEETRPPRQLNKTIPADLETIVLRAIEKNPDERFATAQQLADDLQRFLKDEPIRARRPTLLHRLKKWARRHKPMVWAVAVCVVVSVVALAGSIGWTWGDRAARLARTSSEVRDAINEAVGLLRQSKRPEAFAAARRAEGLLAGGGGHPELRRQVHELFADLNMAASVEAIRLERTGVKDNRFDATPADSEYARAFRDYGIDVEALGSAAAEQIRSRTIAAELAEALDDWALARRETRAQADPSWKRLLAVARAADVDEMRNRLRDALEHNDRKALIRIAAAEQSAKLPVSTLVLLGHVLGQTGAVDQAVALLRGAHRRHPGDFWINHELAESIEKLPRPNWDEVLRYYSSALAVRPQSPGAQYNVGWALQNKRAWAEAGAAYRQAIQLKPDYVWAHFRLGWVLQENGQSAEAAAAWREGIRLSPGWADAHANLGMCLVSSGRFDEAVAAFREAIGLRKDSADIHSKLGNALRELGRIDESIAACREALRLDPNFAAAHCNLGVALMNHKGTQEEAITALRTAIRLQPDMAVGHRNLGIVLKDKGQIDEALAAFREAARLAPRWPEALNSLGSALWTKGKLDDAIAVYRRAIELRPNYPGALCNLGSVYELKGNKQEAIKAFRKAIEVKPDFLIAYTKLGLALLRQGELDEAISTYRRLIKLQPDDAPAHCNLGFALRRKGQLTESLEALRRGHELGSRQAGWTYPSEQWMKYGARLVEIEGRLPAVLRREKQPTADAWIEFAQVCVFKRLNSDATRCYEQAFAAKAELLSDRQAQHRYEAARAAARAAFGQGDDADKLAEEARAQLRKQALRWMQDELLTWRKQSEGATARDRARARQALENWKREPDFANLRGEPVLAKLPEAERKAWREFWAEVEVFLKQLLGEGQQEVAP
jgi:tetratricopeptide (TPR) repeat protein/tRNA A-37 threonylcarbamoyl transferase component Bud32